MEARGGKGGVSTLPMKYIGMTLTRVVKCARRGCAPPLAFALPGDAVACVPGFVGVARGTSVGSLRKRTRVRIRCLVLGFCGVGGAASGGS